ncbi:unnamed protein product [Polarella glacialis]|uniref:C3H1-type domain-containing protein n=1 Tax=Polarella glacialis TaxID=89957 RepID=A0A813EUJ5_POLGL|nr:unnamed protein product [Polarella glacialis]
MPPHSEDGFAAIRLTLEALLLSKFEPDLVKFGVECLSDIGHLETHDLEVIGMNRVQVRKLQREVAERFNASLLAFKLAAQAADHAAASGQRADASGISVPPASRGATGCARSVSFSASVASNSSKAGSSMGLDPFEQLVTNEIVSHCKYCCVEIPPRALQICEADLILQIKQSLPFPHLLPATLTWIRSEQHHCEPPLCKDAYIIFECKSRVRGLTVAVQQLRRRRALISQGAADVQVHCVAVVGCDPENRVAWEAAADHADIWFVAADPEQFTKPCGSDSNHSHSSTSVGSTRPTPDSGSDPICPNIEMQPEGRSDSHLTQARCLCGLDLASCQFCSQETAQGSQSQPSSRSSLARTNSRGAAARGQSQHGQAQQLHHNFKTVLCRHHAGGSCRNGPRCSFAHCAAELRHNSNSNNNNNNYDNNNHDNNDNNPSEGSADAEVDQRLMARIQKYVASQTDQGAWLSDLGGRYKVTRKFLETYFVLTPWRKRDAWVSAPPSDRHFRSFWSGCCTEIQAHLPSMIDQGVC